MWFKKLHVSLFFLLFLKVRWPGVLPRVRPWWAGTSSGRSNDCLQIYRHHKLFSVLVLLSTRKKHGQKYYEGEWRRKFCYVRTLFCFRAASKLRWIMYIICTWSHAFETKITLVAFLRSWPLKLGFHIFFLLIQSSQLLSSLKWS